MYKLNEKLVNMKPYDPITENYKIRLDANESYKNLPDFMIKRIQELIGKMEFNRYPDPYATELCKGFARYYNVDPALVTAGNGSDELISIITGSFLSSGEKMIVISPDFSMYQFYGALSENDIIEIKKGDDLKVDVDEVIRTAKENDVRLICFSNPCNPTSLGVPREEVIRLVESVDSLIVLDEAYMDFWRKDQSLLDVVDKYDNLFILRTCSKALGLAAVRIGFAVGNKTLTDVLRAVKSPYNMNTVAQIIGTALFEYPQHLDQSTQEIIDSRVSLESMLRQMNQETHLFEHIYESNNNFVMIKTDLANDIFEALKKRSIAIRNFGRFLRITAGYEEENRAVVEALREVAGELKK